MIDDLQHDVALEDAHHLGSEALLLLDVLLLDLRPELLLELVDAELLERHAELLDAVIEIGEHLGGELVQLPVAGILVGRAVGVDDEVERVAGDIEDVVAARLAVEDLAAQMVDRLALLVHHVVVLEQVLADVEVVPLDLLLRALDGARDHAVLDRLVLLHAQAVHDVLHPIAAEDAHQVVFERQVEAGGAGVALAAGAAAQLVVDAPRLVPLGAEDVQAAGLEHLLLLARAELPVARERLAEGLRL